MFPRLSASNINPLTATWDVFDKLRGDNGEAVLKRAAT